MTGSGSVEMEDDGGTTSYQSAYPVHSTSAAQSNEPHPLDDDPMAGTQAWARHAPTASRRHAHSDHAHPVLSDDDMTIMGGSPRDGGIGTTTTISPPGSNGRATGVVTTAFRPPGTAHAYGGTGRGSGGYGQHHRGNEGVYGAGSGSAFDPGGGGYDGGGGGAMGMRRVGSDRVDTTRGSMGAGGGAERMGKDDPTLLHATDFDALADSSFETFM